jgi:hypothetical protein
VIRTGFARSDLPTSLTLSQAPTTPPINVVRTTMNSSPSGFTPGDTLSNPFPNGVLLPFGRNPSYVNNLEKNAITGGIPSSPYPQSNQWNFAIGRQHRRLRKADRGFGAGTDGAEKELDQLLQTTIFTRIGWRAETTRPKALGQTEAGWPTGTLRASPTISSRSRGERHGGSAAGALRALRRKFAARAQPSDYARRAVRHQVTEVPLVKAHITEYQFPNVVCRDCRKATRAPLPEEIRGDFDRNGRR